MISTAPIVTDAGKSLLLRAIGGEIITFKRFKIGNGELPAGNDGSGLTDLINTVLSFPISSIDTSLSNNIKITGSFDSSEIVSDFRWRELGVFCEGEATSKFSGDGSTTTFTITSKPSKVHKVTVNGTQVTVSAYNTTTGVVTLASAPAVGTNNVVVHYTDGIEKLYAYANDGDNAGMMKANMTAVVAEQTVAFIIAVGEAENVTAVLSQSAIYASKSDFDNHVAATNPHNVTAAQVGLGNVPNETTNSQKPTYTIKASLTEMVSGETLENAFAKLARAVKNLIAHIAARNNPHGVTYSQAGAAKSEHTHNASDINAGILSVARGGTGCTTLDALKEALGINPSVSSGSYVGNGQIWQFISLGYTPSKVTVVPSGRTVSAYNSGTATTTANSATSSAYENPTYANANSLNSYYHYIKIAISTGGFYVCSCVGGVSSHAHTNDSGAIYNYTTER